MEILQKASFIRNMLLKAKATSPTSPNKTTIAVYNQHAEDYIDNTYQDIDKYAPEMQEWIDQALASIQKQDKILEIGSATLRDANYMRARGYDVTCSDAAINFVKMLHRQGEQALYLNVLDSEIPQGYGMVYANGVFPHFTPKETALVLRNIHHALPENGILAFSIKYGTGEEWIKEKFDDGRFTHYWKMEEIFDILQDSGFAVIFENNNTGSFPSHRWLNIVCKKV